MRQLKQVWLRRGPKGGASMEVFDESPSWSLIDIWGEHCFLPFFPSAEAAIECSDESNYEYMGEWYGPWQVVTHTGCNNERVESTWRTYEDALCAVSEQYGDDAEELGVDIMKNGSTEY